MPAFQPPLGYARIEVVKSFHELVTTAFGDGVNALCWERALRGDFREILQQLHVADG